MFGKCLMWTVFKVWDMIQVDFRRLNFQHYHVSKWNNCMICNWNNPGIKTSQHSGIIINAEKYTLISINYFHSCINLFRCDGKGSTMEIFGPWILPSKVFTNTICFFYPRYFKFPALAWNTSCKYLPWLYWKRNT